MSTIQYCSDLHLEFPENKSFMDDHPLEAKGDTLILGGDIMPFNEIENFSNFFDRLSDQFKSVYWIPGNHEYYDSDIRKRSGSFREKVRDNIFLLNNTTVDIEDYHLIFSTLWSKLSEENFKDFAQQWPDFQQINKGHENFTPADYNQLYEENLSFLKNAISDKKVVDKKAIVVTHHVPTFQKLPNGQQNNPMNEAFAVDHDGLIEEAAVDYWIYGHDHQNTKPFKIGDTKLLTNQLGYVRYEEHREFAVDEII